MKALKEITKEVNIIDSILKDSLFKKELKEKWIKKHDKRIKYLENELSKQI